MRKIATIIKDCFLRMAGPSWILVTRRGSSSGEEMFQASLKNLGERAEVPSIKPETAPPATPGSRR